MYKYAIQIIITLVLLFGVFYYKSKYETIRADKVLTDINLAETQEAILRQNEAIEAQAITMRNMDSALLEIKAKPPEIRYKKIYKNIRGTNDCKDIKNNLDIINTKFINSL